jgi:transposase
MLPEILRITVSNDGATWRAMESVLSISLDERVPKDHLLRRIDGFVTTALADIHERLEPYYSEIGRPSVDPKLMIRMLIVDYCYGLRSERRLTQDVELHLAYRWFL